MADSSSSKKRFTVKPFRNYVQMDSSAAREIWNSLGSAIDEIHQRNASQLSFEELYRNAYNLVLHKHGSLLYEGVADKISQHLQRTVSHLLDDVTDDLLLQQVAQAWKEHCITMVMVKDILMYMDRTYVPQSKNRRPVYELGLHLFRVQVWDGDVQKRVTKLLLEAIASERAGLLTDDRSLLKANLSMLIELGTADGSLVYERDFEEIFLGTTQEFYRLESLDYMSKSTATEYVRKATARLEEERLRAAALALAPTTEGPLQSIVETELIERHAKSLVDSGFAALLNNADTKLDEMREMYDLFSRVPSSVDHMRDALAQKVKRDGKALLADQESGVADPSTFVRGVLEMRHRFSTVVEEAFRAEKRTSKRLREAFEDFLNETVRSASCLAIYVDELLKTGLKGATEAQILAEIDKVIVIFRYLSDKDVFESFYRQHLAKRLLAAKSVSEEAERSMVSLLKAECGYQFTSKLEGMFNDMRISKDTRESYREYEKQVPHTRAALASAAGGDGAAAAPAVGVVDIEVNVLTTGYWPSQNVPACVLPSPVQDAMSRFTEFYLQKHTGRKLSWQTSVGSAELRASFPSPKLRVYELNVSTYQMCILQLFNEADQLTLGQVRTKTQIPDMELRRHLISLCTPKHRLLKKASKGKAITSDDDKFTFHAEYTSKLKRVKVPLVSMKEASVAALAAASSSSLTLPAAADASAGVAAAATLSSSGDAESVPASVQEDRRHLVEAAIVRIMKARKRLHHNDLIAEVTKQLAIRFVPAAPFIKKRMESLIEREYLERSPDDRRVYLYMA